MHDIIDIQDPDLQQVEGSTMPGGTGAVPLLE